MPVPGGGPIEPAYQSGRCGPRHRTRRTRRGTSDFEPRKEVILAKGPFLRDDAECGDGSRIATLAADRVRIEATLGGPGLIVLADGYDPSRRAILDGRPVEVLRANTGFRAVRAPSGRHILDYVYIPRTLYPGPILSAAALVPGGWPRARGLLRQGVTR